MDVFLGIRFVTWHWQPVPEKEELQPPGGSYMMYLELCCSSRYAELGRLCPACVARKAADPPDDGRCGGRRGDGSGRRAAGARDRQGAHLDAHVLR